MNGDFEYLPNPDYDPAKPFGKAGNFPDMADPLCSAARWWCENLLLPLVEEEVAAGKRGAVHEALCLIAVHQVAPPPWLATAILKELKPKPRANAITVEKARAAVFAVQEAKKDDPKASLEDIAPQLGLSESTLDRLIKLYRDHEEKLDRHADNLP